ncbi:DUF1653 domain-containing protein [Acetobacter conturbans]|uniref:DUF1653 domain-containing protein n=1 Tax=Acetobacter conturbans TaxID=1737472 RepID=A0ABX0JXW8_9PROT|nr:DUF1653 domain-containing protein [Acetobacter conturbans]NHN88148.1 DUF1653 domain-containing protein [Acetobacter conturbans]
MKNQPILIQPGLYRHYKGGLYTVLHTARHSETEEWLVVYRSEAHGTLWVRPLSMWVELVEGHPRFLLIEAEDEPESLRDPHRTL